MLLHKIAFVGGTPQCFNLICQSIPHDFEATAFYHPENFSQNDFSIVLIPHFSNETEGLNLLAQIKKSNENLSVILIGENPNRKDIVEAMKLGADDFLFLPVEQNQMAETFSKLNLRQKPPPKADFFKWFKNMFTSNKTAENQTIKNSFVFNFEEGDDSSFVPNVLTDIDLAVNFFGGFSISVPGEKTLRIPGKKVKGLLAYLLLQYPKKIHKEKLTEKFWGDSTPSSARNCLNVSMNSVRKIFENTVEKEVILFRNDAYFINPELMVERDIDLFEKNWEIARHIEEMQNMTAAVKTYHKAANFLKGDFLEEFPYEEWTDREREKFDEKRLVIFDRLSAHYLAEKNYRTCMDLCQKMLDKDVCLEEIHRRLMHCHVGLGMRDKAIRQFHKCCKYLKEELDAAPGLATTELYQKIRRGG